MILKLVGLNPLEQEKGHYSLRKGCPDGIMAALRAR